MFISQIRSFDWTGTMHKNKLMQLHPSIMFPSFKFGYLWQQGIPYILLPRHIFPPGGILRHSQTSKGRCLEDILTSAQVTPTSSLQHAGESAPRSQSLSPTSLRPQKQWNSPAVLEKRGCLKQESSSILKSYWTSRLVQHQQYCRYCIELSRWREHQVERLRLRQSIYVPTLMKFV